MNLVVTESPGEEQAGRSSCCPLPLGRPGLCPPLRRATPWPGSPGTAAVGPLLALLTLDVPAGAACGLLAIGPSPNTHGPTGRSIRETAAVGLALSCCKHDRNGKRGQTSLHRITPFFSWSSASSRQGAWPPPWHLPAGNTQARPTRPASPSPQQRRAEVAPDTCFSISGPARMQPRGGAWHILLALPTGISSVTGPNRYFLRCATAATIMHHGSAGP